MRVHRRSPNQVWVTDITYIRTYEGFLFLAVVLGSVLAAGGWLGDAADTAHRSGLAGTASRCVASQTEARLVAALRSSLPVHQRRGAKLPQGARDPVEHARCVLEAQQVQQQKNYVRSTDIAKFNHDTHRQFPARNFSRFLPHYQMLIRLQVQWVHKQRMNCNSRVNS